MTVPRDRARALVVFGVPLIAVVAVAFVAPWQSGVAVMPFLVAGIVFEAFPTRLREDVWTSLGPVAMLIALMLGGVDAALASSIGGSMIGLVNLRPGHRLLKGGYNFGMFVIATLSAALVYGVVAGAQPAVDGPVALGLWALAMVLASVTHYAVNIALLSLVMYVTGGASVLHGARTLVADGWWTQPLSMAFAFTGFVVFREAGLAAVGLLLVPLAMGRKAMLGLAVQRASLDNAVRALVRLVEVKDEYTCGHAERVADLSDRVAEEMGLPAQERYWIRIGAILHDVGKVGVPLEVLTKPGPLDDREYWAMRRHPDLGADLLATVEALAPAVPLVRQHHERIDGCGYPRGLSGDQVPLATRIVSVVDSWDAMTTTRPYRDALPHAVAVQELLDHRGTQFDADVVDALLRIVRPAPSMLASDTPGDAGSLMDGAAATVPA